MRLFLIIAGLFIKIHVSGQTDFLLFVDGEEKKSILLADSVQKNQVIREWIKKWQLSGHFFAGLDSIVENRIFLHKGDDYSLDPSLDQIIDSTLKAHQLAVNSGFPFALLTWQSIELKDTILVAVPILKKGPFIALDSILYSKKMRVKSSFLENIIGMKLTEPFSEKAYSRIDQRIADYPFIKNIRKSDVAFLDNKAWIYLFLEENSSNQFQGVLGVLPNQNSRTQITGNIDLQLKNLFQSGKELDIEWEQFAQQSQRVKLKYFHPFFLNSQIHLGGRLSIIRQDSNFVTTEIEGNVSWNMKSGKFGFSYIEEETNVLLRSAQRIENENLTDQNQLWFGVYFDRLSSSQFQRIQKPAFRTRLELGQRKVIRNINLPETFYDNISLKSTNMRITGSFSFQKLVRRQGAFYSQSRLGSLHSKSIAANQMFRLGGLHTLRGFNEREFFVESFFIHRLEYRIYFEEASSVFAFWDQGFLLKNHWQSPSGFGLGILLKTNGGLFSFALAAGRSRNQSIDVTNAKVHFGFISLF